ncbi:MAG: hypothetical protein AB8G05_06200 [Oligoflexales bacterium]
MAKSLFIFFVVLAFSCQEPPSDSVGSQQTNKNKAKKNDPSTTQSDSDSDNSKTSKKIDQEELFKLVAAELDLSGSKDKSILEDAKETVKIIARKIHPNLAKEDLSIGHNLSLILKGYSDKKTSDFFQDLVDEWVKPCQIIPLNREYSGAAHTYVTQFGIGQLEHLIFTDIVLTKDIGDGEDLCVKDEVIFEVVSASLNKFDLSTLGRGNDGIIHIKFEGSLRTAFISFDSISDLDFENIGNSKLMQGIDIENQRTLKEGKEITINYINQFLGGKPVFDMIFGIGQIKVSELFPGLVEPSDSKSVKQLLFGFEQGNSIIYNHNDYFITASDSNKLFSQ